MVSADATAPPINSYNISNTRPLVSSEVVIYISVLLEDATGVPYNTVGLEAFLMWSRDGFTYESISMDLISSTQFSANIPRQDGLGDGFGEEAYNYGEGRLYWYIIVRNSIDETDELFSAEEPNNAIYYVVDRDSEVETSITEIDDDDDLEDFVGNIGEDIGNVVSFLSDVFTDTTTLILIGVLLIVVYIVFLPKDFSILGRRKKGKRKKRLFGLL